MVNLKFKTDINCGNCIRAVSSFLNNVDSIENWSVNIEDPKKILSVESEDGDVDAVVNAVLDAGFKIELYDE